MNILDALERWHEVVRTRNPALLNQVLAEDAVFHSPILFKPQQGRDLTALYLTGAGIANMNHGLPDLGLTTLTDVAHALRAVRAVVELPLVVRFGRTVMSLKALSGLGPGSIVDMGRSPDDPVELLVSDKVVAYGEVVIVDGNYGLRITDLVSKSDRMRAVESR